MLFQRYLVRGHFLLSDLTQRNQEYLDRNFLVLGFPIELLSVRFYDHRLLTQYWEEKKLTVVQNGREIYVKQNLKWGVETLLIVNEPSLRFTPIYVIQ